MISIFTDLKDKDLIKFNINEYIDNYTDVYFKMNKDYEYYYKIYNEIKDVFIDIPLKNEINSLIENKPELYNFKDKINSHFDKACLISSLKNVITIKSTNDKDIFKKINKYKKNKFNYYPEIQDYKDYENFLLDFSKRKEFNIHYIPKNKNKSCDYSNFELAPHQLYLKNLFTTNTPYNGILIFHGVGVGKTCSGVSIAENFKNSENKINILAPEKIQNGWNNNIFNPLKGDNQCTGDEYIDKSDENEEDKQKLAKKKIKEFYDMYGYLAFSNMVKKYLEENLKHISINDPLTRKKEEINLIRNKFSNTVLIIDEVHKIRTEDEKHSKDTIKYIEKVIKYSINLKLILLTANPMFNQSSEIIWILNMLLLNDNRDKIENHTIEYNEIDGKILLTKESEELIREKSKGYVSYLRGENPYTFPHRLSPQNNILQPFKYNIFGDEFRENNHFLDLYGSKMKDKQLNIYKSVIDTINKSISIDEEIKLLQISNCVFPNESDNIHDLYGENGLSNCFTINKNKYTYKKNIPEFLDLDLLDNYSCKISSIIKSINNTDGIVFIYSHYLQGGILPLILALEQNGYSKYDGNTVLQTKNKKDPIDYKGKRGKDKTSAKFIVIAGDSLKMTSNFKKELEVVTSEKNRNGELIKIVIGSTVASEGLDFKNIRAIHLLEPWHNINKLEQVIGRGIRNCSHAILDEELRNITIYFHTTYYNTTETIEGYLYHRCEKKAKEIGLIELILKKVAIDKYLFQNSNIIKKKDVKKIKLKPSNRLEEYIEIEPYDKPFSRSCSFLSDFDYLKDSEFDINKNYTLFDDTFSIQNSQSLINVYKSKISDIICDYLYLDLDSIITKLTQKYSNILEDIIYHTLDQMINDKYIIRYGKTEGYLNFSDNIYYFQPFHNPDIFISSYYRINKGTVDYNDYKLIPAKKILLNIPEIVEFSLDEIHNGLESILSTKLDLKEEYIFNINILNKDDYYTYIIERSKFKDKCLLLYSIFIYLFNDKDIDSKYEKLLKITLKFMQPLFIYNNEETANFEWYKEYDKINLNKLYGGFLFFHERNEYSLFQYQGGRLILSNKIQKINILSSFINIKKNTIISKKQFSYVEYNKNYKNNQNGIVLKIKKEKDKRGSIFISSGSAEWSYSNGIKFIKNNYKKEWDNLSSDDKEEIMNPKRGVKKVNKISLSILIECLMRKYDDYIQGDLFWLYNY